MNENDLLRAILGLCQQWVTNTSGTPPVNTVAPVLTSNGNLSFPIATQILSCTTGTWTGSPTYVYSFKWEDGTVRQTGAGNTYHIVSGDVGHAIHCTVTGTNAFGSASADSNASGTVGTLPVNVTPPLIDNPVGWNVGETLYTTDGTWTGATSITYDWNSDNGTIIGQTNNNYTTVFGNVPDSIWCDVSAHNSYGATVASTAHCPSPGSTSLVLKLYADTISGVVTDPVATWPDKSGNSNDATQGTPADQPLLATGSNGHKTVLFDGSNDFLGVSPTFAQPCTLFFVADYTTGTARLLETNGGGGARMLVDLNSTGNVAIWANGSFYTGTSYSGLHAMAVVFDGASSSIWLDGVNIQPVFDLGTAGMIAPIIGGFVVNFQGDCSWFETFSGHLSDSNIGNVFSFLKANFGTP